MNHLEKLLMLKSGSVESVCSCHLNQYSKSGACVIYLFYSLYSFTDKLMAEKSCAPVSESSCAAR